MPGPVLFHASVSPGGRWLLVQTGALGQTLWRQRPDGRGGKLEKLADIPAVQTLSRATIDDDGRVIGAPAEWRGELRAAPRGPARASDRQ